ncbi:MAG TPA: 16S rRNA processing protein RimM [Chitinophagaceae bacterium]|jgi:16S rRNA processing protein RimM|nr:16S rRNA processing protein RimM [Chitinophagaceae bacterium]
MEYSYRNIGKIVSGFGLKGEMIVHHHLGKNITVSKIRIIFLEQKKDELLPYFIENIRKKGDDELYLKLEGIDDKEAASRYIRRDVWMKEEEVQLHTQKNNPIVWVGYRVVDQGRDLGPVLEVIEQPHQVLCRLEINTREVLVPINEQTLDKIDHKTKTLLLTLPDGLLEVYLS